MADIVYTVNQDIPESIAGFEQYSQKDLGFVTGQTIVVYKDFGKNYYFDDYMTEEDPVYMIGDIDEYDPSTGQMSFIAYICEPVGGTSSYWYINLTGMIGKDGTSGTSGIDGTSGTSGVNGLSAYEVWLSKGNIGSENAFLSSLIGPKGDKGDTGNNGTSGTSGISRFYITSISGNVNYTLGIQSVYIDTDLAYSAGDYIIVFYDSSNYMISKVTSYNILDGLLQFDSVRLIGGGIINGTHTVNLTGYPADNGTSGTSGAEGATGPAGPIGATGPAGPIGATGPAASLDTPTYISAYNSSGQSIPNNSNTQVTGWTNTLAQNAAEWDASAGTFTATKSGTYLVTAQLLFDAFATNAIGDEMNLSITTTGTGGNVVSYNFIETTASTLKSVPSASAIFTLIAGQTISVWSFQSTGASRSLYVNQFGSRIVIQEIAGQITR